MQEQPRNKLGADPIKELRHVKSKRSPNGRLDEAVLYHRYLFDLDSISSVLYPEAHWALPNLATPLSVHVSTLRLARNFKIREAREVL